MPLRHASRLAALFLSFGLLVAPLACGGSGSSSPAAPAVNPPSALVYASNPAVYTLGQTIAANTATHGGDAVTGYTVVPALPAGLALDTVTGTVTGMPTAIAVTAAYTVTASNSAGSTSTGLSITVNDAAPSALVYAFPTATYTVGTAIADNTATHNGGAVTTYSISPALPAGLSLNTTTGRISGTPTTAAPTASYTVTAANSGGQATAVLSITVTAPQAAPSFTTQPLDQTVTSPAPATFTVAVTGNPTPALQWQRAEVGSTTWTDLIGATATSFTLAATSGADQGARFRCVATNAVASTTSLTALLSVAGVAKAWQTAARVGAPVTGSVYYPKVAVDALGNAIAIWYHNDPNLPLELWGNRWTVGAGWGAPEQLAVPPAAGWGMASGGAQLSMSATGEAIVGWEVTDGNRTHAYTRTYTPGSGWNPGRLVDPTLADFISSSLRLAMGANGTAVCVWISGGSNSTGTVIIPVAVYRASYTPGTGWSAATVVTTDMAGAPDVAVDGNGNAIVTWLKSNGTNLLVMADGIQVSPATANVQTARIVCNATGVASVVWSENGATHQDVGANRFTPGSGWGTPTLLNSPYTGNYNVLANPQVIIDAAGVATAWWSNSYVGYSYILWSHQPASGVWDFNATIGNNSGRRIRMGVDGTGRILGVHLSGSALYGNDYITATNDWYGGVLLSNTLDTTTFEVAVAPNGLGVAVWAQPDSGGYVLFASVYR